jgi:hypothetical protein
MSDMLENLTVLPNSLFILIVLGVSCVAKSYPPVVQAARTTIMQAKVVATDPPASPESKVLPF